MGAPTQTSLAQVLVSKYKNPVTRLLHLYGHPLAGLCWEQHCRQAITKCGFVKVKGWECLYKHPQKGLFLSVYVDDFKLAGRQENIKAMWTELGSKLNLDPPTPLNVGVYLG